MVFVRHAMTLEINMECSNCEVEMKNVATLLWCPNCGSLKKKDVSLGTPKLVFAVRSFLSTITDGPWDGEDVRTEAERCGMEIRMSGCRTTR